MTATQVTPTTITMDATHPLTDEERRTRLIAATAEKLVAIKTQLKTLTAEKEDLERMVCELCAPGDNIQADGWRISVKPGRKTLNVKTFEQAYPAEANVNLYQMPKPLPLSQLEKELGRAQVEAYVTVGKPIVSVDHE